MHNNTICCDMYPTDDAAHEAAMSHFGDGENDCIGLPYAYPTDDAAHEAALRHFEGNHNDH